MKFSNTTGTRNPQAKLTPEQVKAIRSATGKTQRELAEQYGVCQFTISEIRRRKTWRSVE